jgi:hypothetical protein
MHRRRRSFVACAAVLVPLAGCGDLSGQDVEEVASAFADASGDPEERCALLAEKTLSTLEQEEGESCADALEQLPVGAGELMSVEVWGEEAQAKLADDTLFLTHTSGGWRIAAAACTPQGPEEPYDCQVEGP